MKYHEVILTFLGFAVANKSSTYQVRVGDTGDLNTSFTYYDTKTKITYVVFDKNQVVWQPECALGVILHELAHSYKGNNKDLNFLATEGKKVYNKLVKGVFDIIADHNIEVRGIDELRNFSIYIDHMRTHLSKEGIASFNANPEKGFHEHAVNFLIPVVILDCHARLRWMYRCAPNLKEIISTLLAIEGVADQYAKIADEVEHYSGVRKSGKPQWEYAEALLRKLGWDGEGGEGNEGEGEGAGGLSEEEMEALMEQFGELLKLIGSAEHGDDGEGGKQIQHGEIQDNSKKLDIISDFKAGKGTDVCIPDTNLLSTEDKRCSSPYVSHKGRGTYDEINKSQLVQIRQYLSAMKEKLTQSGKWSGRLRSGSIAKAKSLKAPFYKNTRPSEDIEAAVYLLIDCSGSMGTRKLALAAASAAALAEAMDIDGVVYEVAGFTTRGHTAHNFKYYEFKLFDDPKVPPHTLTDRVMEVHTAGNDDDLAMQMALERTLKRKEKRKIVIVLSDGYPAGARPSAEIEAGMRGTVQLAEDSNVFMFGIGIESESVEHYYKHYCVVHRADELPSQVLGLLKEKLINK